MASARAKSLFVTNIHQNVFLVLFIKLLLTTEVSYLNFIFDTNYVRKQVLIYLRKYRLMSKDIRM